MGNPKLSTDVNDYMFRFLEKSNEGYDDDIALTYMGVKISHREFKRRRDLYAKALLELDVKPGEIVSFCMPSTPETVILFYAINMIGAVSNFIDITKDAEYIHHCLVNTDSRLLIAFDGVMNNLSGIFDQAKLEHVVYLSVFESFSTIKRAAVSFAAKVSGKIASFDKGRSISWKAFLKLGQNSNKEIVTPPFVKNQLCFIEYSSGTTGMPKAIELTNECGNEKAYDYGTKEILTYERGDSYLNIIPVFLAFGVMMGAHVPMSLGMAVEEVPAFKSEDMIKYFKSKPHHWFLTPPSFSHLIHDPSFATLDFSETKSMGCGGDALNRWQNIIVEESMHKQGFRYKITNGFGASELGAPFCTCTYKVGKPGSVGLPMGSNEMLIFKHGTRELAAHNEIGDVCMIEKHPMLGYHNNETETKKVMIELPDGITGIMLGDKGYLDEDGFIFIKGRAQDVLMSNLGEVWPVDIESVLTGSRAIIFCAVSNSAVADKLTAYIEADTNKYPDVLKRLKDTVDASEFKGLDIEFKIVDKVPLTLTGKIDRKALRFH
jgi:long-chain acyl-CoA synthetase